MTATYNTDNTIAEQPWMKEPFMYQAWLTCKKANKVLKSVTDSHAVLVKEYHNHLASLRTLACSPECRGLWKPGQVLEEGKDYKIFMACIMETCSEYCGKCPLTAHPVVPVKSEADLPENSLILTAFQNEPVNFLLSNALRHLTQDQQMQLCNALRERLPPPASAEDEAARMYPYDYENYDAEDHADVKIVRDAQRLAHIRCAGMYTGEIERLKAELEQSLLLYNNQTATIFKLEAENSKMRKLMGEAGYCTMCLERKTGEGLEVCKPCYDSFDGDRRGFWKDEDY